MPITFQEPEVLGERLQTPDAPTPPDLGDTIKAAFETQNTLASALARDAPGVPVFRFPDESELKAYDPFDDIKGYEPHADSFIHALTPEDTLRIKRDIDRELTNRRTLDASGWSGAVSQIAAGVLDPVFLPLLAIPGGAEIKALRAAQALRLTSPEATAALSREAAKEVSALATAGRFALFGGGAALTTETTLHATQETRTLLESSFNITGATLLSGVLGAAAARLTRSQFNALAKGIEDDFLPEGSVGAAELHPTTLPQETLAGSAGVAKATKNVSPILRTLQSPSLATRQTVQDLAEHPFYTQKNVEGIANRTAVETLIKQHDARIGYALENLDSLYVNYRTGKPEGGFMSKTGLAARDLFGGRGEKMSFKEFREAVGEAMRHNDTHAVPQVQQSARIFRNALFDPLKEQAIELKLLPEDVRAVGADTYLSRVYKHEVIKQRRPEFRAILEDWITAKQIAAQKAAAGLEGKLKDSISPYQFQRMFSKVRELSQQAGKFKRAGAIGEEAATRAQIEALIQKLKLSEATEKTILKSLKEVGDFTSLSKAEIQSIADDIINNILGHPGGRIPRNIVPKAGALKERTLTIPDELIKDFLESDIELIAHHYNRTLAPEVELVRRFGSKDMKAQLLAIENEYDRLIQASPQKAAQLAKDKAADLRDLSAMRDLLLGLSRAPVDPDSFFIRAGSDLRKINFLRMLGGMTVSSLSDLANPVMAHGLRRWGKALVQLATSPQRFKLAAKEVKQAGTAWDMVLHSRAKALADIGDNYKLGNAFERGLKRTSDTYGVVTLMSPWNAALKQFAGVMTATRILEESANLAAGKASKAAIRKLAQSGIDETMARRIAAQMAQHGDKGDVWLSQAHRWTDREAAQVFQASVVKNVDSIIVTPGVGDRPLWMSSELGKLVGQFKSFAFASVNHVLIARLQQRDMAVLNGALLSAALGSVTYGVKQKLGNREISDDRAVVIREAIDRSGMLGYLFDVNNIMEKATRGSVGISALTGGPPMSRYASRNVLGALLGPSADTVSDLSQVIGAISTGDVRQTDIHAIRKLLPYQNLFYLRKLFDLAEQGTGEALGVPAK